jgi:hypothetical protein
MRAKPPEGKHATRPEQVTPETHICERPELVLVEDRRPDRTGADA